MNNPYSSVAPQSGGVQNKGVRTGYKAVFLTPDAIKRAKDAGVKSIGIGTIEIKDAEVWGRAENHPNGTYTETVVDDNPENEQVSQNVVVQKTRKRTSDGKDPVLLTRVIYLNQFGQPGEVRIFEGDTSEDRYRYQGKFIYDARGRLIEQQLRDARGTPLRRIIQEYAADGTPLPLKSVDYSSNFPADLKLVVTRENPELFQSRINKLEEDAKEMEKWHQRFKKPNQKSGSSGSQAPQEQKRKFQLFRKRQ